MQTRLKSAILLGVLGASLLGPNVLAEGEDEDADETTALPLAFKTLEWGCSSRCVAVAKDGALLCLEGSEGLSCDNCWAGWVAPGAVAAKKAGWKPLLSCGQMAPSYFKANLRAINLRTRGATPVTALFYLPLSAPPTAPQRHVRGDLALVVGPDAVTVTAGDRPPLTAAWRAEADPQPGEEIAIMLYPLKDGYVGVVVIKHPDMVMQRTAWLSFAPGAAAAKDAGASSPGGVAAAIAPWLAGFCAGTLTAADFDALAAAGKTGAVTVPGLVALFNAHGALYGYEFKQEVWLNALFAAKDALPEPCRPLVGSFSKAADVPARFGRDRDRFKAIWKAAR